MNRLLIWLLSQPLLWAGLGVSLGPYFFWRGFRLFQRKRLIMDIPRSTIRAAALGCVEVSGKAVGPYTVVAPLSGADCYYDRVVVTSHPHSHLLNPVQAITAPRFPDATACMIMTLPRSA